MIRCFSLHFYAIALKYGGRIIRRGVACSAVIATDQTHPVGRSAVIVADQTHPVGRSAIIVTDQTPLFNVLQSGNNNKHPGSSDLQYRRTGVQANLRATDFDFHPCLICA